MPRIDSLPRRIVTLKLPAPYDIFTLRAWIDYPREFTGVGKPLTEVLDKIVVEHDIEDADGKPFPTGEGFAERISPDFAQVIWTAVGMQVGNLPPVLSAPSRST